jgi:hypothetical protein
MINSFQLIQQKIEFVIDRMSLKDPRRDELILAKKECEKIINHFINDGK